MNFDKKDVTYEFHHIGYITTESHPNEGYSKKFDMWTTDIPDSRINAQYHRFGPNSPLHPLLTTVSHVAFKVNDLDKAVQGEKIIMEIYEPIPGYRVAAIEDAGFPIELVETSHSYDELVHLANTGHSQARDVDKED